MPTIATRHQITNEEAFALLEKRAEEERCKPTSVPEFRDGERVILDTGDLGVVVRTNDEGQTEIVYLTQDGDVRGPATGYRLTRVLVGERVS